MNSHQQIIFGYITDALTLFRQANEEALGRHLYDSTQYLNKPRDSGPLFALGGRNIIDNPIEVKQVINSIEAVLELVNQRLRQI